MPSRKNSAGDLPGDMLSRPPQEAARLLAISFLDEARSLLERLDSAEDPEALHDFRVSIRRLRSTLRAYERELEGSVSKKVRKRLKKLWKSTSSGRDTEVQLAWLDEQKDRLTPDQKPGLDWLVGRLEARRDESYEEIIEGADRAFSRIEDSLRRKLSTYCTEVRSYEFPDHPRFCSAVRRLVDEHAADLQGRLAEVQASREQEDAHKARISLKRLRYLLEPLESCIEKVEEVLRDLKGLQDLLGELQDMHVLSLEIASALEVAAAQKVRRLHELTLREDPGSEKLRKEMEEDERIGLLELAKLVKSRQDDLFEKLAVDWLSGRAKAVLGRLEAQDTIVEEKPAPRSVEIERKYLLTDLPPHARENPAEEIEQGWVRVDKIEERLRRVRSADRETYWRTFKVGDGVKRTQIEEEVPAELFEALWPFTRDRRIAKRRYKVREGNLTWEIDEFLDRNLHLAEVEIPSVDSKPEPPAWLGPYIIEEVTGEPDYRNARLAGRRSLAEGFSERAGMESEGPQAS